MGNTYTELQEQAKAKWEALLKGEPPRIFVGTATCGKAAGGLQVMEALRRALSEKSIEAEIYEVGCNGLCYAEVLVDIIKSGQPRISYRNVTPEVARQLVEDYLVNDNPRPDLAIATIGEGSIDGIPNLFDLPELKPQVRVAMRNCGIIAPGEIDHYLASGGYAGLARCLTELTPEQALEEVEKSGLRGRGGAAFSTGMKWKFIAGAPGPVKYHLCNAEEGDPGAFNDKGLLESDPHTLIEGTVLAGYATGANRGYVFIRHGHDGPIDRTRTAVQQAHLRAPARRRPAS
ncbi:MAG: NADH-quinone oxidoreductase subunit F, partial [Dehalococcoidia bacterium]